MYSKRFRILMILLASLALGSILFAACSRPGTSGGSASSSSTPASSGSGGSSGSSSCPNGTVHLTVDNFAQNCVNVSKGSKLTLVDDGSYLHILSNGTWVNGNPQPAKESGAPTISNVQINGGSTQIGPFNTAGTFHIYCSIHVNMNLTVNVK
ncbi:MAG TPA: hypothetical protein VFA09_07200 [Ktedonobacteraceae bacterium]|nr:hypothetical protein [Ktedonobacteraceae bacterium]